ncbi:MAG TPA: SH3 domain-containing protein [Gemmatimonadales bacterium]|nr:SH3 domain-containing protein [Gemmatimonadales bacterium]
MRPFLILFALLGAACRNPPPGNAPPERSTRDTVRAPARDTALEAHAARLELRVLEGEAQVDELQTRLDDARREVVRAMAKLQSLATRAEAASGMAEAEIALQSLRPNGGATAPPPELTEGTQLLQLATVEFNKRNYGGALYLATEAKTEAAAGQGRLASDDQTKPRSGEVPFALPLHLRTTARANVRDGPGASFRVTYTLDVGAALTAYSYVDQWVRVSDDGRRPGWIHQGLIERRPTR